MTRRGFVYLTAVVDWFSRKVLASRLSITIDVGFCIEAVEEAMARFGKPHFFNTVRVRSPPAASSLLISAGIEISMDGQGARRDNVFVEQIWRSVNTRRSICAASTSIILYIWPSAMARSLTEPRTAEA